MKSSAYYKACAKNSLKDNWGNAIGVMIVVLLASSASSIIPIIGSIVGLLITGQLAVGEYRFYTKLVRNENAQFSDLFENFQDFFKNFLVYILQTLLLFLWALLLIIPAIIKSYSYAMTLYLKNKHPELKTYEAISLSSKIMKGKKWKLFCLQFSFFGWILLGVITFGIAFLYVMPYMQATTTKFFEDAYSEYNYVIVE